MREITPEPHYVIDACVINVCFVERRMSAVRERLVEIIFEINFGNT